MKRSETIDFNPEYDLVTSKHQTAAQLANRKGNIAAMVQIGSVGGALFAFILADKIGKSPSTDLILM